HLVRELGDEGQAELRGDRTLQGVALLPLLHVVAEPLERLVTHLQEMSRLEVVVAGPPTPANGIVEARTQDVPKSVQGILRPESLHTRITRVIARLKIELLQHLMGQIVVAQGPGGFVLDSRKERPPQQQDLNEVVEVTRLEGRILP